MHFLLVPHKAVYSRTCVKRPLSKRPKNGFQDELSLNADQKYCRMLPLEQSAILSTFIKLPFVIKIFVSSIVLVTVLHRFHCTLRVNIHPFSIAFIIIELYTVIGISPW